MDLVVLFHSDPSVIDLFICYNQDEAREARGNRAKRRSGTWAIRSAVWEEGKRASTSIRRASKALRRGKDKGNYHLLTSLMSFCNIMIIFQDMQSIERDSEKPYPMVSDEVYESGGVVHVGSCCKPQSWSAHLKNGTHTKRKPFLYIYIQEKHLYTYI